MISFEIGSSKCEVLPRLELGLPDSKSEVLTNYTIEPVARVQNMVQARKKEKPGIFLLLL